MSSTARPAGGDPGAPGELLESLATSLSASLPADVLDVRRERGLADRIAGRAGAVTRLEVTGPELTLTLAKDNRGRLSAQTARVVRGVVISRQERPVAGWLELLAGQLHALAATTATDDAAVGSMLTALGVRGPADDVVVAESDVAAGLRALPDRITGRVPEEARATTARICELLLEALPRVQGMGEQEYLVRRAATDYLPRTLRSYLVLPTEWARTVPIDGSRTAAEVLVAQLAALEEAAGSMRAAALAADTNALLANGRFLADRFGTGLG